MSCDDDDYGWDDEPQSIIEIINVNLTVNTLNKAQLGKIADGLTVCLNRKLDKLNLILKNLDVYGYEGSIIVNDRFNICPNLTDIVTGFGMDCLLWPIAGLKGKTYAINDKITELLKIAGSGYRWGSAIPNLKSLGKCIQLPEYFKYSELHSRYDSELEGYLHEIQKNGIITRLGTETIVDGVSQGVTVDVTPIENKLSQFNADIQCQAKSNNRQLQNGTTEILYARARQMGYAVEKKTVGKTVQLVMVRTGI